MNGINKSIWSLYGQSILNQNVRNEHRRMRFIDPECSWDWNLKEIHTQHKQKVTPRGKFMAKETDMLIRKQLKWYTEEMTWKGLKIASLIVLRLWERRMYNSWAQRIHDQNNWKNSTSVLVFPNYKQISLNKESRASPFNAESSKKRQRLNERQTSAVARKALLVDTDVRMSEGVPCLNTDVGEGLQHS